LRESAYEVEKSILFTKAEMLVFPGDKTLVADLLKQVDTLQADVDKVQSELSTADPTVIQAKLICIQESLESLQDQLHKISDSATDPPPNASDELINLLEKSELSLLIQKVKVLNFSGDKSLMTDIVDEMDKLEDHLKQLRLHLNSTTLEQASDLLSGVQSSEIALNDFLASHLGSKRLEM
jgi:hypothetical protein